MASHIISIIRSHSEKTNVPQNKIRENTNLNQEETRCIGITNIQIKYIIKSSDWVLYIHACAEKGNHKPQYNLIVSLHI